MAGIKDILNSTGPVSPTEDRLNKNLASYVQNKDVLEALGKRDPSTPLMGLLEAISKPLSVPGNLVRAGIAELTGTANQLPQLAKTSGKDELLGLLSGNIRVGAGDLPMLRTKPGEGVASRALKMGGAFVGDVVTDPLSYLGAPSALSRKASSTLLIRHALSDESQLLDRVIASSAKKDTLLDDLAKASPQARAADLKQELDLTGDIGTPLDMADATLKNRLAKETLANYLGEGLYGGGRSEVINRLEVLTGNRNTAKEIYDTLPEDIKGGIVVSNPFGQPLTDASGKAIRITSGYGDYAGAKEINKLRLAASQTVPATFAKKYFSGGAGEIFAAASKNIAESSPLFKKVKAIEEANTGLPPYASGKYKERLVDYVIAKDAAKNRGILVNELTGKARAVAEQALKKGARFGDETSTSGKEFTESMNNAFFAPLVAHTTTTEAQIAGSEAGKELRAHMEELFAFAKDNGVDTGQIGDVKAFSPLMYTKETYDREMLTEAGRMKFDGYNPAASRQSFIEFFEDPEVAKAHGYAIDPENPNVVALDARKVNERLKAQGDSRVFETDAVKVFTNYADVYANKVATRKFLQSLTDSGIGISDSAIVNRAITKAEGAILQSVTSKLYPEMAKQAKAAEDKAFEELGKLIDVKTFNQLKTELDKIRVNAEANYKESKVREMALIDSLDNIQQKIDELEPTARSISANLEKYGQETTSARNIVADKDKLYRSLRATIRRSEDKLQDVNATATTLIDELRTMPGIQNLTQTQGEEIANLIKGLTDDKAKTLEKIRRTTIDSSYAQSELKMARKESDLLTQYNVDVLKGQFDEYVSLLAKREELTLARESARSARRDAYDNYYNLKGKLALEGKETIDEIVNNYRFTKLEADKLGILYRETKAKLIANKVPQAEIDNFIAIEGAKVEAAHKAAVNAKDVLYRSMSIAEKKFGGIVAKYSKSVLNATENMNAEEFQAFRVLRNENKMQEYIFTIANNARDSREVYQAMGDLNKAYNYMRKLVPQEAYEKLSTSEKKFMDEYNSRILERSTATRKSASEFGKALAEKGLKVSAATPATSDLFVTNGVKKWLDDLYHTNDNPNSWQRYITDVLDPLLQLWKQTVTVGRGPGFVATNVAGGMFMNHQGGVKAKHMKTSFDVILRMRQIAKDINKEFPDNPASVNNMLVTDRLNSELSKIKIGNTDLGTAFAEFYNRGAFDDTETQFGLRQLKVTGQATKPKDLATKQTFKKEFLETDIGKVETIYRKGLDFAATNRLQAMLNDMNQSAELYMRFGAFISGVERYKDFASAMDLVHLLHFDYQDLTHAENWVRRLAPFYTWTRNNVPAQLRSMVMQPGKIQRAMYFNQEFKDKFGADGDDSWINQVLPEYMDNANGFYSIFGMGEGTLGFINKMPYEDVNKLFQVNEKGQVGVRTDALASMLGPIGTPLQMAGGVNYQTGQPLGQDVKVSGLYNLLKFVPGSGVRNTPEGTVMSGTANLGLNNLLPMLGISQKVVSSLNTATGGVTPQYIQDLLLTKAQQEGGLANLLNTTGIVNLIGLSATTGTTQSIAGNVYGKTVQQQKAMSSAAKDLGIDTAWIKQQVKNGVPNEQIALMIQSGMATKKEPSNISSTESNNLMKALAILNSP